MKIVLESINTKEIGVYPQINLDVDSFKSNTQNLVLPNSVLNKKIPAGIGLPSFIVAPKAILTDYLIAPALTFPKQLIISKKLSSILQSFKGLEFDILEVNVKSQNGEKVVYDFLNYVEMIPDAAIDLPSSIVKVYDPSTFNYKQVEVSTAKEFKQLSGKDLFNLVFNEDYVNGLHHFIAPLAFKWIISDELAHELSKNKISGLDIYHFDEKSDITINGVRKLKQFF